MTLYITLAFITVYGTVYTKKYACLFPNVHLLGIEFFSVKDSGAKNREEGVRTYSFLVADDDYDEE